MPVINTPTRKMGNNVVTEIIDSVGTIEVTYTFSEQQDTLIIGNMSGIDLIFSVGKQQNIEVKGFKEATITSELFNELKIKSKSDHGSFRLTASFEVVDEEDEKGLFDKIDKLTDRMKTGQTFYSNTRRPLVTFIDDDGNTPLIERLFPLYQSKGIKGSAAIITGKIGKAGFMTEGNLQTLKNAGWEMLGHGYDYANNLTEFPVDADLDYQLGQGCKGWLEQRGHKVDGFVFPQGTYDVRIRTFTKKHYTYAFAVGYNIESGDFIDSMGIKRVALGSFTTSNPTIDGNSEKNTFAYYKACVDNAVTNNGLLVFMTHVGAAGAETMSEAQWQAISDIIDYIKSINVEIVTPRQAYETFGNKVFIGDTQSSYYLVNEKGTFQSPDRGLLSKTVPSDSKLLTDGITIFDKNTVSVMKVTSAYGSANGFPDSYGGTLFTYYHDLANVNYNRQEYWANGTFRTYVRYPASSTTWSEWLEITTVNVNKTLNAYTAAQLISTYQNNQVTIFYVNSTGATGFPNNGAGIVTTYRLGGNGWHRQEFRRHNSHEIWVRYVDGAGAWGAWSPLSPISGTTASRPTTGTYTGMVYYDTTLNKPIFRNAANTGWVDATGTAV